MECLGRRKLRLNLRAMVLRVLFANEWKAVITLKPDDDVHRRGAAGYLLTFSLGDTSCNGYHGILAKPPARLSHLPDAPEFGIHLFRSLLADMASVENDEIGIAHGIGFGETGRR